MTTATLNEVQCAYVAQGQAVGLERVFVEFHVTDEDLDALTGLRLIAEAVA